MLLARAGVGRKRGWSGLWTVSLRVLGKHTGIDRTQQHRQRLGIARLTQRLGRRQQPLAMHGEKILVESLLATASVLDVVGELERSAFEDVLLRHRPAAQNFNRGATRTVVTDHQPL